MDEETTTEKIIKVSIWTPLLYVGVLMTSFIAFSIYYRRRKLQQMSQKVEPIFSENHAQSLYLFLKQQYNNPELSKDQKPDVKVLKAALLRRAVEAIRRSLKLKEVEPSFNRLYQEGLIGDDMFKNFQFQAKFQEVELGEIVAEAKTYKEEWVTTFFPVAQEICFNEALRRRLNAMDERSKTLSIQWQYLVEKTESVTPEKAKAAVKEAAQAETTSEVVKEK